MFRIFPEKLENAASASLAAGGRTGMEVAASSETFLFESFRFDQRGALFRRDGAAEVPVAVGSRALDILAVLVARPGEVVSKEEIAAAVWPGRLVEDSNLTVQIAALRRVLDCGRPQGSCIQTITGRGYRFVAPVRRVQTDTRSSSAAKAPRLSVVVLPFVNLGSAPDQQYFADAITDDLTTDLSRISGSIVISRNTAFTYKGKPVDVKRIGHELNIRYVIEGSVRRIGCEVRVNVQLTDAETGTLLWADRFDATRANLTEAQDEIAGRLAATLNLKLIEDMGARIGEKGAVDANARDLIMRGRSVSLRPMSGPNRQEALRVFERALEVDPQSIDAKIGIGGTLVADIADGLRNTSKDDEARAEQLLIQTLEQDASSARSHERLGLLRRLQNRLRESEIELRRAIALDPNSRSAHQQLGNTLTLLCQPEAAIPQIEKAIRLSPFDANVCGAYFSLGRCHLLLNHLDEAVDFLRKARAGNPRIYVFHLHLVAALGLKGDLEEAEVALIEALKVTPEINSVAKWRASRPDLNSGQYRELAEKMIDAGLRKAGMPE